MISSGSMCQVMVTQKSYNLYFYLQSKHDCYYKKGTKHFRKWPYIDIITTYNHSCCHRHIVHVRSMSWGDFGMVVLCQTTYIVMNLSEIVLKVTLFIALVGSLIIGPCRSYFHSNSTFIMVLIRFLMKNLNLVNTLI